MLGCAEQLHLWATPTTSLSDGTTQMNDVALRANEVLTSFEMKLPSPNDVAPTVQISVTFCLWQKAIDFLILNML